MKTQRTRRSRLSATSRLSLNADVGSGNILATARTMEPPPPTMQRSRTTRKRFRRAKPETANENGIQQGVPPLRATSGAKVNADVRKETI